MKKTVTFDEEHLEQVLLIPTNKENKASLITSCFYSSFVFISNIVYTYIEGYYLYSVFFFFLLLTSLLVHSNIHRNITLILDKIPIVCIVLYGGYIFFEKCLPGFDSWKKIAIASTIVATFLITIFLYVYGYWTKQYCYCEDETWCYYYHSLMHIISSIGHNLIVYL